MRAPLVNALSLAPLLSRKPYELSGGQKQRAALLLALLKHPKYLLLDEPFSAQDQAHKDAMIQCIEDYVEQTGALLILTSHQLTDMARLTSEVTCLDALTSQWHMKTAQGIKTYTKERSAGRAVSSAVEAISSALDEIIAEVARDISASS